MGSSLGIQTNRLTAKSVNDSRYTLTSQDIESEMYKQAAMRKSNIVEPIDILMAVARQGHGSAGFILREVIKSISDPVAKEDPIQYLKSKPRLPVNGTLNENGDKPVLGSEATNVLMYAERVNGNRGKDRLESIDILTALFEDPASLENIGFLQIKPQNVLEKIDLYLNPKK